MTLNGEDERDGDDLDGATCAGAGFDEGSVSCNSSRTRMCQLAAETSQGLLLQHLPQGVVFTEQLVNGLDQATNAVQEDASIWAGEYSLDYPVVYGADPISTPAVPTYFILDRELCIQQIFEGYPGDSTLSFSINSIVNVADTSQP